MSLDELPPLVAHRREQEWYQLALRTEAADRAAARRALAERDACESVEATETLWAGIFALSAKERPQVHYEDGYDWRRLPADGAA